MSRAAALVRTPATTPLLVVMTVIGVLAQHPVAQDRSVITPEAKRLNESYKTNCERFIVSFEDPARELFRKRVAVIDALGLKPGMSVADVGAGSGFFSLLMAQRVGPSGIVYAEDISPCLLEHIAKSANLLKLANVTTILGTITSPKLPASKLDVIFMAETYHHFENPISMMDEIKKALKPNGVLWLIDEDRVEGVSPEWLLKDVRAGGGTFTDEIRNRGFELIGELDLLDYDYVLEFKHRGAPKHPPEVKH